MNVVRTAALLAAMTGLSLAVGVFFGGTKGMTIMFVVSLLMNFVNYWFSDKIVLSMYGAREATPHDTFDLIRILPGLAQKAKLPMPRLYIINNDVPNAFATGRGPQHAAIAVTTGLMRVLTNEELAGVISHELAHIKNHDTLVGTVVATSAGIVTMIANIAHWTAFLGFGEDNGEKNNSLIIGIEFIFFALLTPIAAILIQLGISRSREFQADKIGSMISGNPIALANALKKIENYAKHKLLPESTPATSHMFIVNPFNGTGNWLMSLFGTHPAISDRITRLNELAKHIR